MSDTWMIISWKRDDAMDGSYGHLLHTVEGTLEQAKDIALDYVPHFSPVGIVKEIKP